MATKIKQRELADIKQQLIAKQYGLCPLCQNDLRRINPRNVVVDHDHDTGIIRAALCRGCNGAEGKMKNLIKTWGKGQNPITFLKALTAYWLLHSKPQTSWIYPTHKTATEKLLADQRKKKRKREAARKEVT